MSTVAADGTCPVHGKNISDFSLMDPMVQSCPFEFYKLLRAEQPVYQMPETGMFVVTKYEDVRMIKKNPEVFSSDIKLTDRTSEENAQAHDAILRRYGWENVQTLQRCDPPEHNRYRKLVDRVFTAGRVKKMKPYIDGIVNDLIDAFIEAGSCEFVADFAVLLPCYVIADQLGVYREDVPDLKKWSDAMLEPASMPLGPERLRECAHLVVDSQHYFYKVFEDRRKNPKDDIMSGLIHAHFEDEEPLSMHELQNLMNQLLTGGNETTTSAIAHGLWLLLRHPEQMALLRNDLSRIDNFAEEVLRYETPVQGLFRQTTRDTEIRGVRIPANSIVIMRYGAANRDEEKFDDPDRFDITRKNAGAQIAFGMGAHFCPGAMLARQEIRSAFTLLLERLKHIELARDLKMPYHHPSIFLHQFKELPIRFEKA